MEEAYSELIWNIKSIIHQKIDYKKKKKEHMLTTNETRKAKTSST